MPFTPHDFHEKLDTDLWLIDKILTLPSDPPEIVNKTPTVVIMNFFDFVSMPAQQEAVRGYREDLLPAVFIVTQKVYAEFFRLVLGNNTLNAGDTQFDIENKITNYQTSLVVFSPFSYQIEFADWWDGSYKYEKLRIARNHVVHNRYTFAASTLIVLDNSRNEILRWDAQKIIEFSEKVLVKAQSI